MAPKSIKVNYFLNISRVVIGTLVGLFTMPYVNKILGAEGLGKVEFVNSIITYFLLFSALGIPMYGIRETAKVRDNRYERSKLVVELLSILACTTLVSYLLIFGFLVNIDRLSGLKELIILMSSMVFFANIGVEWFYQGIEDQLFITIRYIIVRLLTLVLLFVMVKSPEDYLEYGLIVVLTTVGSNFFNLLYLKKHISLEGITWKNLQIRRHFKPILTIFVATISVSIYLQLDNLMLGSIAGEKYVGFYAMANKLVRFAILFITTLGSVLLPRLSHLVHTDKVLYLAYSQKAINYILIVAIPATAIFFVFAQDFTMLMGGKDFQPAVITMRILSLIILVVGIAYFVGYLVLYPMGKERFYTVATIFSAVLSVVCNMFIIPVFFHNGTAAVAVISEILGIFVMCWLGREQLRGIDFFNRSLVLYLLAAGVMVVVAFTLEASLPSVSLVIKVLVEAGLSIAVFFGILLILKEAVVWEVLNMIKK